MIRLHVLGSTELTGMDGQEVAAVLSQPKRLALLAYLVSARGFVRRDALVAMFWPELDATRSREALNQSVRFLRKALGGSPESVLVRRGADELGIEPGAIWSDVTAFRQALEAREFDVALDHYRGDLLPGFFAAQSPGFEQWLETERSTLRSAAAQAAVFAADSAERSHDHRAAIQYAERAVELAALDERVVRELLARLDRLGDRAGAIHAYTQFVRRLAEELEAEPAAETKALVDRIRSRDVAKNLADGEMQRAASEASRANSLEAFASASNSQLRIELPNSAESPAESPQDNASTESQVAFSTRLQHSLFRWRVLSAAGATLLAAGLSGFALWRSTHLPAPRWFTFPEPATVAFNTSAAGFDFALSRDGNTAAFVAGPNRELFVRHLDSPIDIGYPSAQRVSDLHFSPDGNALAFVVSGVDGGPAVLSIGKGHDIEKPTLLAVTRGWTGVAWAHSEDIVYMSGDGLWRASRTGAAPRKLSEIDTSLDARWYQPTIMPDGRAIAFRVTPRGAASTGSDRLAFVSVDGGTRTLTDLVAESVIGYVDGALVFSRLGTRLGHGQILAVRFDPTTYAPLGEPAVIVDDVDMKGQAGAMAMLSANGTLVYVSSSPNEVMQIVDGHGAVVRELSTTRQYRQTVWSPDGKRIAMYDLSEGVPAIYVFDTESGVNARLPNAQGWWPAWTADGKRVAYTGWGSQGMASGTPMWIAADGSDRAEPIPGTQTFGSRVRQVAFSPDRKSLVVRPAAQSGEPDTTQHAFALPLGGSHRTSIIAETRSPDNLVVSPNSKWIAFSAAESKTPEVYVRSFPLGDRRVQISMNGGFAPKWADNGRKLFYRVRGGFRVASLDVSGALPRLLRTDSLFADHAFAQSILSFDAHPDGKQFVVTRDIGGTTKVNVVLNWTTVLREKLAAREATRP